MDRWNCYSVLHSSSWSSLENALSIELTKSNFCFVDTKLDKAYRVEPLSMTWTSSNVVVDLVGMVTPYNMLGLSFRGTFSCKWKPESEMHRFQKSGYV